LHGGFSDVNTTKGEIILQLLYLKNTLRRTLLPVVLDNAVEVMTSTTTMMTTKRTTLRSIVWRHSDVTGDACVNSANQRAQTNHTDAAARIRRRKVVDWLGVPT